MTNDQCSNTFNALQVYKLFCYELEGGRHWLKILEKCYHEVGQVTGSADIATKIDGIEDEQVRVERLRKWGLSYVFQWWVNSWKAGGTLRNLTEQTYLWKEGGTRVRPRVVLTSVRMRALWKAVSADKKAKEFKNGHGPRLEEELKKLEVEDTELHDPDTGERRNRMNQGAMI